MSVIVTIDLGDGRLDNLRLFPHSNLKQVAEDFCKKHKLPKESCSIIIDEIKKNSSSLNNETPTKTSSLSSSFSRPTNPGVKLYEKGLKYMEIIQDKIQKFKKIREEKEKKNLTFSPKINKSNYASSVDILLKCGVQTRQKLEKMRGERLNLEINECSFSPKINKNSLGLAFKRRSLTPNKEVSTSFGSSASSWNVKKFSRSAVFESLHQDARNRSENRKQSESLVDAELFTFRPDLSKTREESKKYLKKRGKYQRISDFRKQLDYYLRVRALDTDLKTGQALFTPKINEFQKKEYQSPKRSCCKHKESRSRLTPDQLQRIVRRIEYLKGNSSLNKTELDIENEDY